MIRGSFPTTTACSGMLLAAVQAAKLFRRRFLRSRYRGRWCIEIGGVEIIFTGNSDQREKRITSGIGQGRAHPMRRRGLADRADWPIRGNPFPRSMRQYGREIRRCQRSRSIAVVCTVAISCWPRVLRTISSPLESGA